ncbi:MAG: ATP-binding protein [Methylovulum sp.]|nr:ATP-binding protein [Methylovulum sp.]
MDPQDLPCREPEEVWQFSQRLPNTLEALPLLAEAIEAFGQQASWQEATVMQINLVLEELVVNTIDNGYTDGRKGDIDVEINAGQQAITLRITDDADAFDPFSIATPDLTQAIEDRAIGGLGIHLVRSYMDDYRYAYVNQHNQVTLTKKPKAS